MTTKPVKRKIKKDLKEEFRKRVLQFEVIHTPEFMVKHLPKSGPYKNRFQFVSCSPGGIQRFTLDYRHFLYPGYKTVTVKLKLSIIARASKWKEFKIDLICPDDLDAIEKMRVQRDAADNIRYDIRRHLARYF